MSTLMTRDEMREAMRRNGVGEPAIENYLYEQFGPEWGNAPADQRAELTVNIAFPIVLTVPWSALCSDNDKYAAVIRGTMEKPFPQLTLTAKYRAAKKAVQAKAKDVMGGCSPLAMPLSLIARVYVPDNRPGHDVANFAKCCHDAMEKAVYVKDEWLHDVRWIRAGVDVDRPRAELEIRPL